MNGDFETIEQLGVGAFGVVCLCRQRGSDQLIARKEIRLAALDKLEVSQLREEVKVLEKFRDFPHRNLVEGKGYLHMDDTLCIYMEYCERGSLAADIGRRQEEKRFYDETTVLDYTHQIASALDHMHRHLVIHRDLRPANVLVTRDGVIKLADFGLGALLSSKTSVRTAFVGTPLYMAPEIINAEKYNFSCDIWSFGTVLYELMALQPAFMAPNLPAIMKKVLSGNFSPLEVPYCQPLKVLVQLMLVVDPSKRPDSSGIAALNFLSARMVDSSSMGELDSLLHKEAMEREEVEEKEIRRQRREAEEKRQTEEEEQKRREEVEQQRRKEEELRQREADVEEKLRQLRVRDAEEQKRTEEEERKRREETERQRRRMRREDETYSACLAELEAMQRKQRGEKEEPKELESEEDRKDTEEVKSLVEDDRQSPEVKRCDSSKERKGSWGRVETPPPPIKESLHATRSEPWGDTKGTCLKRPAPATPTQKDPDPQLSSRSRLVPPSSVPSAERKNKSNSCLCLWW